MKKYILFFLLLSCGSEESRLADSYYQNKNYNKAIEYYTESLKLEPNDTQSLYRRGRSFEEIKQFQNAIKDYNKVLELDKENVNAILSLAINSLREKKYVDAELYAKKVRAYNWSYHNIDKFFPSEMIVRRYNNKSEFNYHHDDIIEEIFPQWFVRRKNILTCNIYLNDDNEYEGGDLHFASCNLSFKPKIGDVIISPSNWMFFHKVNEITSGVRYSGTYWYYYGSGKKVAKRASHSKNFSK